MHTLFLVRCCAAAFTVASILMSGEVRATAQFALDPSFGTGGKSSYAFDLSPQGKDRAAALVTRPDGSFYIVGTVQPQGGANYPLGFVRYTPDGSLDDTFVPTWLNGMTNDFRVFDADLQADGSLVVGVNLSEGVDGDILGLAVCRFHSDGSRDMTFAAFLHEEHYCFVEHDVHGEALMVHSSGLIIVAGGGEGSGEKPFLLGIEPDKGYAAPFGEYAGIATPGYAPGYNTNGQTFFDLAEDSEGRIVAVGQVNHGFMLSRFEKNGDSDTTFGTNGTLSVIVDLYPDSAEVSATATSVAILPDDAIVVAGFALYGGDLRSRVAVAKLDKHGEPIPQFNGGKPLDYEICMEWQTACRVHAVDVVALSSGRIVIGGSISRMDAPAVQTMFAFGLTGEGVPDPAFGDGYPNEAVSLIEFAESDAGASEVATALVRQGDRVLIGGYAPVQSPDNVDFAVARLGRAPDIFADSFQHP